MTSADWLIARARAVADHRHRRLLETVVTVTQGAAARDADAERRRSSSPSPARHGPRIAGIRVECHSFAVAPGRERPERVDSRA